MAGLSKMAARRALADLPPGRTKAWLWQLLTQGDWEVVELPPAPPEARPEAGSDVPAARSTRPRSKRKNPATGA
jgi:hypothetical protein